METKDRPLHTEGMTDMTDATPTIAELAARLNAWALCFEKPVTAPIPKGDGHWSGRMMADLREAASALSSLSPLIETAREGWKEATIAWAVCASIHRDFAHGKDPLFSTRQGDFVKHEADCRERALSAFPAPASPWRDIASAPHDSVTLTLACGNYTATPKHYADADELVGAPQIGEKPVE